MKLILGGHWASAPQGWTALTEADQDITKRLKYDDESVDAIFTEHVIEHITMQQGIFFVQESFRVLKRGGVFRVVAPMIDQMVKFKNDEIGIRYANEQLKPFCREDDEALRRLGIVGIEFDTVAFLFDSLVRKHGHRFLWTTKLMSEVLKKVGFAEVNIASPGVSLYDPDTLLERRIRGTNAEKLVADYGQLIYDPESGIVEARK